MSSKYLILLLIACFTFELASAQDSSKVRHSLSGYITDAASGEVLIGATVYCHTDDEGTTSNGLGYYNLLLNGNGEKVITVSFVGYKSEKIKLTMNGSLSGYNISLTPSAELIPEFVVSGSPRSEVQSLSIGRVSIKGDDLEHIPNFLGERDIIHYVKNLPGVAKGTEGFSGLIVHGGNEDENLYLLDGVPIYNPNHMMGLFSIFNADDINDVSFYKGSFPTIYGGRTSSVLDVRTKKGHLSKLESTASIGLISSQIHIDGPIVKDRTTFSLSARRSYFDLFTTPIMRKYGAEESDDGRFQVLPIYYFWDMNAKLNHIINSQNQIGLIVFTGRDQFIVEQEDIYTTTEMDPYAGQYGSVRDEETLHSKVRWGSNVVAANWQSSITPSLFVENIIYYSKYISNIGINSQDTYTYQPSNHSSIDGVKMLVDNYIEDIGIRSVWQWNPLKNHHSSFGIEGIYHIFPQLITNLEMTTGSKEEPIVIPTSRGSAPGEKFFDVSLFLEDKIELSEALALSVGIRAPFRWNSTFRYLNIEPRVILMYSPAPTWSVKMGYTEMSQHFSLLQASNISLPTNLWVPITSRVKPKSSRQVQAGFFHEWNGYELSIEGYYKQMFNLLAYKDGAETFLSDQGWPDRVETGQGSAYGLDLLLKKNEGRLTGMVAYSLSWSKRWFPDGGVNEGEPFWDKYDNRHHLTLSLNYHINKTIDLSALWTISSGNKMTLPTNLVKDISGTVSLQVPGRNNFQYPTYHRLDVGATFAFEGEKVDHTLRVGAYNAYLQRNPFMINVRNKRYPFPPDPGEQYTLKSFTLFPIIPSLSYTIMLR